MRPRADWLVLDVSALSRRCAHAGPPSEGGAATERSTASAEERLQRLKRIYEQGLITADEYERKRREILQQL